jgi:hypothetical protein
VAAFQRLALRIWVTEMRPWWMAQSCADPADPGDSCVMLARIDVPIIWVGGSPTGAWVVDGAAADIAIDEQLRPILGHLRLLQEWLLCGGTGAGPTVGDPIAPPPPSFFSLSGGGGSMQLPFMRVTSDLTLDETHHFLLADGGPRITLPKAAAENRGRVYVIKNIGAQVRLQATSPDTIEGTATKNIKKGTGMTVVSDGAAAWFVIGETA